MLTRGVTKAFLLGITYEVSEDSRIFSVQLGVVFRSGPWSFAEKSR